MITINNEPTAYTPIFLGTTQHSLRLSLEILIMVGMKLNDEIIETYNVTVSAIELGQLPDIGSEIAIDEITGSEYQVSRQNLNSLMQKYKIRLQLN